MNDLNDGYSRHGDYLVELTSIDASRNEGLAQAMFTIDLTPPQVRFVESNTTVGTLVQFEADDDDGAMGGVITERLYVRRCLLLDGATFGDGDGLLSDEYLDLGQMNLCTLYEDCGITVLKLPNVRIEATDCGGNTGADTTSVPLRVRIKPTDCGERRTP